MLVTVATDVRRRLAAIRQAMAHHRNPKYSASRSAMSSRSG
jgi:hypothetical protein